jgi:ATP-dependent DNA ligase
MKSRSAPDDPIIKAVQKWKHDQAIISLSMDRMLEEAKDKQHITEQKVDGQTAIMEYKVGEEPRFGSLHGMIIWDLPLGEDVARSLKSKRVTQALIVGEMAGYANGKIIPFNESESLIKNPKSDKTKVHWFPYEIIELNGKNMGERNFETYKRMWPELKRFFSGSKYVHPVEYTEGDIEGAYKDWVEKQKNEGIVVRLSNNKVYKVKPSFSYDLVVIAVGDKKKGHNWPKKMISMVLLAFMDGDRVFRTAGHVASGFTDAESREIFAWAQKNKVGEDTTYVWVKPEKIMEVQWERTSIKEMPSYKYSRDGYEKVEKRMSGTVVKPRFIRWRTDKSVNPNDLRLSQIPDWGKMKKMALRVASKFAGFMTVQSKTWREIEAEYEKKYGKNHHRLALECVKCGGRTTCRCSTPKTLEKGVCYYCTGERQRPEPLNFDKEE